jgi:hypothetical protein
MMMMRTMTMMKVTCQKRGGKGIAVFRVCEARERERERERKELLSIACE